MKDITASRLALLFHETYERMALGFGYETRTETRAFDVESPNGKLMVAVCQRILLELRTTPENPLHDLERGQTYSTLEQVPVSIEHHLREEIAQYRALLEDIRHSWLSSDILRLRAKRLLGYDNPSDKSYSETISDLLRAKL